MEPDWQRWLNVNVARGCQPSSMLREMVSGGINEIEAVCALADELRPLLDERVRKYEYVQLPRVPLQARRVGSEGVELFEIEGFIGDDKCDEMVEAIRMREMRPSGTTEDGRPHHDPAFRTSRTLDFAYNDALAGVIDGIICAKTGLPQLHGEALQAQVYRPGEEFRAHSDYFVPTSPSYIDLTRGAGQRTWTVMVYLNDVAEGGGTYFDIIDYRIQPKKGRAAMWNNICPDGTLCAETRHAGEPPIAGEKLIITKWFREKPPIKPAPV